MPHIVTGVKRTSSSESPNYSHCPLKKRPIKYDPTEDSDSDVSYKGIPSPPSSIVDCSEPENLSTKPEDLKLKQYNSLSSASSTASLSPPPIALVAHRGNSIGSPLSPHSTSSSESYYGAPSSPPNHHVLLHHHHHREAPYQSQQHHHHHRSQYSPGYLSLTHPAAAKPVSGGGPLEPISLNPPAAWSKMASAPVPHIHHHSFSSLSPPAAVSAQRSYLNFVSSSSSSPPYTPSRPANVPLPQFHTSHFAPFSGRDAPGSPPHVSPPLTAEPAYPVIKIEEAHRGSRQPFSHQHLNSQTKFYEEITTPVAAHQNNHHHQHHHSYHHSSAEHQHKAAAPLTNKQEQLKPKHSYHSPPHSYQSTESRDSVISQNSVSSSSSNSQNQQPVAPPPQLSQITPINVNGSVRYQCPDCNKSYSTFSGLSKHIQFHCASQNKKQFICKFCEKVYVSLGALKMHIRTHTLPCKCNMCGKAFSRPWLLQGHIRTHTGEKPFSCQHCNRAFADRSNLRAHLQTHSEVKKYSCKHCSKTFSRMSLLVKHEDGGCSGSSGCNAIPLSHILGE